MAFLKNTKSCFGSEEEYLRDRPGIGGGLESKHSAVNGQQLGSVHHEGGDHFASTVKFLDFGNRVGF